MPKHGMMCPMMGGMMSGGGMMGMMGGESDSPRMIQMRGEMMKAMGEIMMKYGKMMDRPPSSNAKANKPGARGLPKRRESVYSRPRARPMIVNGANTNSSRTSVCFFV
jgi:hypothetical protein